MININQVSTESFLQSLSMLDHGSREAYTKGFQIDKNGSSYTIHELTSERKFLSCPKVALSSEIKVKTAEGIQALITENARAIATKSNPNFDGYQIAKVLDRYKPIFLRGNLSDGETNRVTTAFDGAIATLNRELSNHAMGQARTNFSIAGKTQWSPALFLEKMSKTWPTGRPNFKFYVKNVGFGAHLPFTERKLWSLEKLFYGKSSGSVDKVAMMKNMEEFIDQQMGYIKGARLNASGIDQNIKRLGERMKRNMDFANRTKLVETMGRISTKLGIAQNEIDVARSEDPTWMVWNGVKYILSVPKQVFWNQSDHLFAPVLAYVLGRSGQDQIEKAVNYAAGDLLEGFGSENTILQHLKDPAIALAAISAVQVLTQRLIFPALGTSLGQLGNGINIRASALGNRIRTTRPYRAGSAVVGGVTYTAWATGSVAYSLISTPFKIGGRIVQGLQEYYLARQNRKRQVMA